MIYQLKSEGRKSSKRNTPEEEGVKSICWDWDEGLDQVHVQHDVHTVGINRKRRKEPKGEL